MLWPDRRIVPGNPARCYPGHRMTRSKDVSSVPLPRLLGESHEHGAQVLRSLERPGEDEAQQLVAQGELQALRIEADEPPRAFARAAEPRRIERHRLGVILVHVFHRMRLQLRKSREGRKV